MTRTLTVIGVPCSAGAHHGGLERGPAALRAAGLPGRLRQAGWEVSDACRTASRLRARGCAASAVNTRGVRSPASDTSQPA